MTTNHRRNVLKGLAISLPAAWSAPLVKSVILPAHAQTSCGTFIRVTSPFAANGNVCRVVAIADDGGQVLASCCCGRNQDIVIEADNLSPGTYRIAGDSDGPLSHMIIVDTGCESRSLTVTTSANGCNFLMATVSLPDGTITGQSGQPSGLSDCGSDGLNCVSGDTGC